MRGRAESQGCSPHVLVNSPAFRLLGEGSNRNSQRMLQVLSPSTPSKELSERFCFNELLSVLVLVRKMEKSTFCLTQESRSLYIPYPQGGEGWLVVS